jgi:hypothetical protein
VAGLHIAVIGHEDGEGVALEVEALEGIEEAADVPVHHGAHAVVDGEVFAQAFFAEGNNEWPVVKGAVTNNAALAALGTPKMESVSIATIGKNQIAAQRNLDRVGYR